MSQKKARRFRQALSIVTWHISNDERLTEEQREDALSAKPFIAREVQLLTGDKRTFRQKPERIVPHRPAGRADYLVERAKEEPCPQ